MHIFKSFIFLNAYRRVFLVNIFFIVVNDNVIYKLKHLNKYLLHAFFLGYITVILLSKIIQVKFRKMNFSYLFFDLY